MRMLLTRTVHPCVLLSILYRVSAKQCEIEAMHLSKLNYSIDGKSSFIEFRLQPRPLRVHFIFTLDMVQRIDQIQKLLTLRLSLFSRWPDPTVRRVFEAYPQCDVLLLKRMPGSDPIVWLPDLYFYNLNGDLNHQYQTSANLWATKSVNGTYHIEAWIVALFDMYCPMDFSIYPLDRHACKLRIGSEGSAVSLLRFSSEVIHRKVDPVNTFHIAISDAENANVTGSATGDLYSVTGFTLHLQRSILPFVLNVYLPTSLLVVASWIGFFVPADMIPGRMALLVTILLMLINTSSTVIRNSPSTNGVNGLDVWVIGTQMFVAAALFEYAAILGLKHKGRTGPTDSFIKDIDVEVKCKEIDRKSAIVFPIVFLLFSFVYWICISVI